MKTVLIALSLIFAFNSFAVTKVLGPKEIIIQKRENIKDLRERLERVEKAGGAYKIGLIVSLTALGSGILLKVANRMVDEGFEALKIFPLIRGSKKGITLDKTLIFAGTLSTGANLVMMYFSIEEAIVMSQLIKDEEDELDMLILDLE